MFNLHRSKTHSFEINRVHLLQLLYMTSSVWIKHTPNKAIDFCKVRYACSGSTGTHFHSIQTRYLKIKRSKTTINLDKLKILRIYLI